jgi:hypothetical protein
VSNATIGWKWSFALTATTVVWLIVNGWLWPGDAIAPRA